MVFLINVHERFYVYDLINHIFIIDAGFENIHFTTKRQILKSKRIKNYILFEHCKTFIKRFKDQKKHLYKFSISELFL